MVMGKLPFLPSGLFVSWLQLFITSFGTKKGVRLYAPTPPGTPLQET